MEAKYPEITLGEPICIKIKEIFYPNIPWPDCYRKVADKFTELKHIARKFYAGKDIIEILQELNKYNQEDIADMFHVEHDAKK